MTTAGRPAAVTDLDDVEGVAHPEALGQRLLGRVLDDRAVQHRIGERQADLDQVAAALDHRGEQVLGPRQVGYPAGR